MFCTFFRKGGVQLTKHKAELKRKSPRKALRPKRALFMSPENSKGDQRPTVSRGSVITTPEVSSGLRTLKRNLWKDEEPKEVIR